MDDNEIAMTHRHEDTDHQPMVAGNESRIDGLVVREFECPCGYSAAVLSRAADDDAGPWWGSRLGVRPA